MSVTNPETREEFEQYILRKLGSPLIQINVSPDQIDMMIEESLQWFWDYHYNGTEHTYLAKEITQTDIDTKTISLPKEVSGVFDVYSIRSSVGLNTSLLSGGWQMMSDLVWSAASGNSNLSGYYIARMNYEMVSQILIGETPIRFNEHNSKLYIDKSWDTRSVGEIVIIDCYTRIDPEENPSVWNDRFLKDYATQKVKYLWGENLSKYTGMTLPGGIQFDGPRIRNEAELAIIKIEEMLRDYSVPPRDYMG